MSNKKRRGLLKAITAAGAASMTKFFIPEAFGQPRFDAHRSVMGWEHEDLEESRITELLNEMSDDPDVQTLVARSPEPIQGSNPVAGSRIIGPNVVSDILHVPYVRTLAQDEVVAHLLYGSITYNAAVYPLKLIAFPNREVHLVSVTDGTIIHAPAHESADMLLVALFDQGGNKRVALANTKQKPQRQPVQAQRVPPCYPVNVRRVCSRACKGAIAAGGFTVAFSIGCVFTGLLCPAAGGALAVQAAWTWACADCVRNNHAHNSWCCRVLIAQGWDITGTICQFGAD